WLFGAGAALVLTATNVLMRYAFFAGQTGAAVNLGYVYIAVGTLVIPVLAEAVWRKFGFKRLMGLLALLCLAPALVAALTPPPSYPVYREGDFGHVFHDPMIWVAGLVFLLYGPLEV